MSKDETRALVRRFLDAVNARDGDSARACLAEDVALDLADGRRAIGDEAFRDFLAERLRRGDETMADVAIMTDEDGGRAAAEFTRRGRRVSASGAPGQVYSVAAGMFFEVDDGKITRVSDHAGRAEAD